MARKANNSSDDSSDRRNDTPDEPKKQKSRRPPNTAFRQQRLKAWQPILTPKTVLPIFFVVGIIFAPIGGLLIYASSQVQEISIDYTYCNATEVPTIGPGNDYGGVALQDIPSDKISSHFKTSIPNPTPPKWGRSMEEYTFKLGPNQVNGTTVNRTLCTMEFELPNDIGSPVYFYYRLTNFYQNHRRYVSSLDVDQLRGQSRSNSQIDGGDCDPLKLDPSGKAYYPCGLIANSLFNDTIETPVKIQGGNTPYEMTQDGIAWGSDRELYNPYPGNPNDVVPPPNWQNQYPNGTYTAETIPNLKIDYPFQVWMRTAGLPNFSKLARRNDNQVMTQGVYRLRVWMDFPVEKYGGTKSLLISTRSVMGGKNPFLGIAYIVVGGLCIVLGAVFTATHLIKPRKLGDHTYLTWNNDQPTAATTTGRSARPEA